MASFPPGGAAHSGRPLRNQKRQWAYLFAKFFPFESYSKDTKKIGWVF